MLKNYEILERERAGAFLRELRRHSPLAFGHGTDPV